jgi:hypothetical protein
VRLDDAALTSLADRVWSPNSATFHKGRIGGWRDSFDAKTTELFAAHVPAELMRRYGYGD